MIASTRSSLDALDHQTQKLLRGRVDPVYVLVDQEHRLFRREALELVNQYFQRALLLALRQQVERRVATFRRQAEQGCDQRYRLVQLVCAARQERLQLVEPGLEQIVVLEGGGALQLLDQRVQRAGRVMGRALIEQADVELVLEPYTQFPNEARLADPRLARQQHHLTFAVPGLLPAAQQKSDLLLTADKGCEAHGVPRLEAPLGSGLAGNPPRHEGFGEALEPLWAEVRQLEQTTDQLPGGRADDDASRRGDRLQPRRQVRGGAAHRVPVGNTLADQIAHHDVTGRDAHAGLQADFGARLEPSDLLDQLKPGAHRPLGVVLVRLRPAEIGEHAIADVFGDVPAPTVDRLGAGRLIGADDLAHVLRVEPGRQLGRTHQIDEHHRQLPPLGFGSRSGWRWRKRCFVRDGGRAGRQFGSRPTQSLYRPQEDLAVTK